MRPRLGDVVIGAIIPSEHVIIGVGADSVQAERDDASLAVRSIQIARLEPTDEPGVWRELER